MKEPHIEGVAIHDDPESCVSSREGRGEALTGARTGAVLSRENRQSGTPTQLCYAEGKTHGGRHREPTGGPARSETRGTCGISSRENREIPGTLATDGVAGRAGKAEGRTPAMHVTGKSDRPIVPTKPPNKAGQPAAEVVEGRGLAKGNTNEQNAPRTQWVHRRERPRRLCSRTSTFTMSSTSGSSGGENGRRAERSSSCVMPTTSSLDSSSAPTLSGSWWSCANDSHSFDWNCTPTKHASSNSGGSPAGIGRGAAKSGARKPSTSSGSPTSVGAISRREGTRFSGEPCGRE
jgi:hypothetical protein